MRLSGVERKHAPRTRAPRALLAHAPPRSSLRALKYLQAISSVCQTTALVHRHRDLGVLRVRSGTCDLNVFAEQLPTLRTTQWMRGR